MPILNNLYLKWMIFLNNYDIAMIRPHLFLGSLTAAADSRLLKNLNIHAIVNLD